MKDYAKTFNDNFSDWSTYLQRIKMLEKHGNEMMLKKNYKDAYERILEIEHNCRMARAWILQHSAEIENLPTT